MNQFKQEEILKLQERSKQAEEDCREFRENFVRLEQLVQLSANSEYAGLLDGLAFHLLENTRVVLRFNTLETNLEDRFLPRAERQHFETQFADKKDVEAVKRELSGSFNNLKQRVQDMGREAKELEHSFGHIKAAVDMAASIDQFSDISEKLKDFAPLYRVTKIEAALEQYLKAESFQKYKGELAGQL